MKVLEDKMTVHDKGHRHSTLTETATLNFGEIGDTGHLKGQ